VKTEFVDESKLLGNNKQTKKSTKFKEFKLGAGKSTEKKTSNSKSLSPLQRRGINVREFKLGEARPKKSPPKSPKLPQKRSQTT